MLFRSLRPVQTLATLGLPDEFIESELEGRFLAALGGSLAGPEKGWAKVLRNGKPCHTFRWNGRQWVVEPQVLLGEADGAAVASKPDFVLWPLDNTPGVLPVAVFMDGFAYHVRPEDPRGGVSEDILKRMAIIRSRRFLVWSLTWDDLEDFAANPAARAENVFTVNELRAGTVRGILARKKCRFDETLASACGMCALLGYLENPDAAAWGAGVAACVMTAMSPVPPLYDAGEVEKLAERLRTEGDAGPAALRPVKAHGDCLAAVVRRNWVCVLLRAGREAANLFDWKSFSALLRVEDGPAARRAEGYKAAWRCSLASANLLQFLPGFEWLSTGLAVSPEGAGTPPPAEDPDNTGRDGADGDAFDELLDLCDESCRGIMRACAAGGKPVPVVGYELEGPDGRVCGEAELAWPVPKVAVLTESQTEHAQVFESQGWMLMTAPEASSNVAALLDLL